MNWKGWWGDNPPCHVPTFILTHHAREPIDELHFAISPVLLGSGERLFEGVDARALSDKSAFSSLRRRKPPMWYCGDRGAMLTAPPADTPRGTREMVATDPDGNRLRFASEATPA